MGSRVANWVQLLYKLFTHYPTLKTEAKCKHRSQANMISQSYSITTSSQSTSTLPFSFLRQTSLTRLRLFEVFPNPNWLLRDQHRISQH
jgi:hypothetical protein